MGNDWIKRNPNWTDEENARYKKHIKIILIVGLVATIIFSIIVVNSPGLSEDAINFWSRLGK